MSKVYDVARAVLSAGSAHSDVPALGAILAEFGQETTVTEGTNPFGIVDESILRAVANVRADLGIDDEEHIPGVPVHERSRWIGPAFWDGVLTPGGLVRKPKSD